MEIIRTYLHAGLPQPVKLLHITDVHLTSPAPDDPAAQREHLTARTEVFRHEAKFPPCTPGEYFAEAFALAEAEGAFPIVTGDVMDINCRGTREEFVRIAGGRDFLFTPGSHEFAEFCRSPRPGFREFYAKSRSEVEALFPHLNYTFDHRIIGGVNVITMDNDRDYFPAEVCDGLRREAERGLPMLLFMHDPLADNGLLRVNEPNPNARVSDEDYRRSDELITFIGSCPLVLATFAGHWHGEATRTAPCGATVYVTPGLFKGICRVIEID